MTTKTEEQLAEAFKAGFIEACNWPEPVPQDADSPAAVLAFGAWRGNQAAHEAAKSERAQAEPLAWCEVHAGKLHGLGAKRNDAMGLRTPLYTQPPQQVSVPDGWVIQQEGDGFAVKVPGDDSEYYVRESSQDVATAILTLLCKAIAKQKGDTNA